jgi:ankyrin repeat protein
LLAFFKAAQKGDIDEVRKQIDLIGDVNRRLKNEEVPEHIDLIGDVNRMPLIWGEQLLHIACQSGFTAVAKLLIERGADINGRNAMYMTPLCSACENGHLEIAELLAEKGADINSADMSGFSALFEACTN